MKRLILTLLILAAIPLVYGDLTCSIEASSSCSSGTRYIGLENDTGGSTNAHAQNASIATYAHSVCCESSTGTLDASCTAGGATMAKLSSEDNAHLQGPNQTGYSVDVCISHSTTDLSCESINGTCGSGQECVMSLSGTDDAHAGACGDYDISICCEELTNPADIFSTQWKTDNAGDTNSTSIALPLESSGNYSFTVDWGDGTQDTITTWNQTETTHDYGTAGTYTVNISGTIEGWRFGRGSTDYGDAKKFVSVDQWGTLVLKNYSSDLFAGAYFYETSNLAIPASDAPNLSQAQSMERAFSNSGITDPSGINSWDVSAVQNFNQLFQRASFNGNISSWNVSSVTTMNGMFWASSFDQDLDQWDVSSVTNMASMFQASPFNGNISTWDTSSLSNAYRMFGNAGSFNQPLNSWNTSSLTNTRWMFQGASSFNQPLDNWDVSSVTSTSSMFKGASAFDQDLGSWNVSSVTDMTDMFLNGQLSKANYDSLLAAWANLTLQSGVDFHAGSSVYSVSTYEDKKSIIDTYNWTITDGGPDLSVPTLLEPVDNANLTDRKPTFNWSADDASDIFHELNISAPAGCSSIPVINTSRQTSHTSVDELCVDNTYDWTVRSCLDGTCSSWANTYNFTIEGVVGLEFSTNSTSFGSQMPSTQNQTVTNDTLDDDPAPLVLRNTGNVRINTTIHALDALWSNQPLNTSYFQFADENSSSWLNTSSAEQPHTGNLSANTTRELELRIEVPINEPPGTKSSTVQATGVSNE